MSNQYQCDLPAEVQKYAQEVLNETEENRRKGFDEIKKWSRENKHLHVRTEEKYILPFLRGCKFDLDKTKTKLRNYYTMRRDRAEWFTNRDPRKSEIQLLVKKGCCLVLKQTQQNRLVTIIRPTLFDPHVYNMDVILKTTLMIVDIAVLEEELAQIYGVIVIIDLSNVSFAHSLQFSVSRVEKIVHAWGNYHSRPQLIQFVNGPAYINVVLNLFKMFMSEKMKQRLKVSVNGHDCLVSVVDKFVLPKDYGGDGEAAEELGKYWLEKLIHYRDWFVEDAKYKAE